MKRISFLLVVAMVFWACSPMGENAAGVQKFSTKDKVVSVYTTAENTDLRLTPTGTNSFEPAEQARETEVSIFVNPEKSFQTFWGIGGALTDASAEVFAKLPVEKQEAFLKSYYDVNKGIGYTLARVPIHSCDFSSASFTYISDTDQELKTFSIDHDQEFRIPFIKKAIQAAGGELPLYASPWSPPPHMKSNGEMLHGGYLLPEYYDSWALYYTKFIKAYEAEGMPIWGITLQNEPMATQTWESCIYTAEQERDFLKNHLGPTMVREGLHDKKIIVWDHNRDLIANRAHTIFGDPEASKYAWGIGYHWYETWTGSDPNYNNLNNVTESYPDKKLVFTEGCAERFIDGRYEYWPNAERYGNSMINDFNQGTVGWTDWNILLDETGGPNHVGNLCFAPVHANTQTGELVYTPTYYYIGHFSKFIRPGAKRISTSASRTHLESTSFLNEDGKMVTVVMNHTDDPIDYKLYVGTNAVRESIPAHAMQTLLY
ncbi:MAG: glycoside hydrolase family 30 protein [Candidatus Marinimicrobia bacterium]|nr:glycoside hydrolase family 30 protein [Candidatus Neomarinimicrobiota bacterium]